MLGAFDLSTGAACQVSYFSVAKFIVYAKQQPSLVFVRKDEIAGSPSTVR